MPGADKIMEMSDEWELVLYYNPLHSESYILDMLTECLPNVSETKAMNLYLIAYTNGQSTVFHGFLEHAEHFFEKMLSYPLEYREGKPAPPVVIEMIDPSGKKVV